MPAARRRGGKSPEPTAATETVNEPAEDTGEDKPKRTRAPKEYKIVSEEMADLVNEFLDTEEFSEGDEITGALVARLRAEGKGMKWDGTDENPGIKYVAGIKSAIPLRTLLQKHEATTDTLDGDPEAVVDFMKANGAGWTQLSVRTGLTVAEVKELIKETLAEEDIDVDDGGRGYGKGDSWRWVSRDELNASKAANKESADSEDDGDEEDDEDDSEDAPAPGAARRRGRAPASA